MLNLAQRRLLSAPYYYPACARLHGANNSEKLSIERGQQTRCHHGTRATTSQISVWNSTRLQLTETTSSSLTNVRFYSQTTSSSSQTTDSSRERDHIREEARANESAAHFKRSSVLHPLAEQIRMVMEEKPYTLPHPIWTEQELNNVAITHIEPSLFIDKLAYYSVYVLRKMFDLFSGYAWGKLWGTLDERKWLTRIVFLETVAGVPGMVGAMVRHLRSLRHMDRDHGWIHTLLEEAENERMHLLTALVLKKPGRIFKGMVIISQGMFVSLFSLAYLISPRFCHRFVGYLEEEAVRTYSHCLECLDNGDLKLWPYTKAPPIAINYWKLSEDAMMRDVILAIRADEAHHRQVNHTLSSMDRDKPNPFGPGE